MAEQSSAKKDVKAKNVLSKKRKQRLTWCNRFSYPFDISRRQSPPHIIIISLVCHTILASSIKFSLHPYVNKSYGHKTQMFRSLIQPMLNIHNSNKKVLI